eukprot:TRINITY_DN35365_c0_g2_i9.p1 TRINITY_DN35365_c0_g2~~TRINITY_DN35365_c0_g2_i9.p1  ORF type:complete len:277 (+),score=98.43 TRINITY_DN35365_c0_g2_i9:71-901(+)
MVRRLQLIVDDSGWVTVKAERRWHEEQGHGRHHWQDGDVHDVLVDVRALSKKISELEKRLMDMELSGSTACSKKEHKQNLAQQCGKVQELERKFKELEIQSKLNNDTLQKLQKLEKPLKEKIDDAMEMIEKMQAQKLEDAKYCERLHVLENLLRQAKVTDIDDQFKQLEKVIARSVQSSKEMSEKLKCDVDGALKLQEKTTMSLTKELKHINREMDEVMAKVVKWEGVFDAARENNDVDVYTHEDRCDFEPEGDVAAKTTPINESSKSKTNKKRLV